MSHSKIRSEKICLNCGTDTPGRYCPACGQENIEPKQSAWHLINHFFSDITHFDGKFFLTVKDLFAKPGFLSREYMQGRRVSYLDPIRMYIFTSAFFFLIFFSLYNVKNLHFGNETRAEIQKDPEYLKLISQAKTLGDSMRIRNEYNAMQNSFLNIKEDTVKDKPGDSTGIKPGVHTKLGKGFHTVEAYDSAQKALPPAKRDGWLKRKISTRTIEISLRFKSEPGNFLRELTNNFMHEFPKVLFISLPVFALLLKLLYFRHKQFYYVDHGIFAVHLYIFSFLLLLVYFGFSELRHGTGWGWLKWPIILLIIYPFIYYYKSMRQFYGQRRAKTIFKYILLFFMSFFIQLFIFLFFALFTLLET